MENITLGQIALTLTFLVGLISSVAYLANVMKKQIDKLFEPIRQAVREVDKSQCKNYLVRFLKDKERGIKLSEIEIQRAHEAYEHYTEDLKGNNYIHAWWEKQMGGEK